MESMISGFSVNFFANEITVDDRHNTLAKVLIGIVPNCNHEDFWTF